MTEKRSGAVEGLKRQSTQDRSMCINNKSNSKWNIMLGEQYILTHLSPINIQKQHQSTLGLRADCTNVVS